MNRYSGLTPRDLSHLASCRRRGVSEAKTFDQALHAVAGARTPIEGQRRHSGAGQPALST